MVTGPSELALCGSLSQRRWYLSEGEGLGPDEEERFMQREHCWASARALREGRQSGRGPLRLEVSSRERGAVPGPSKSLLSLWGGGAWAELGSCGTALVSRE